MWIRNFRNSFIINFLIGWLYIHTIINNYHFLLFNIK